ncbi:MAG: hypothetical protein HYU28_10550 [Actinobacteria bacterium]|nr:hypothetical protein [Actinomycetota bacterium]
MTDRFEALDRAGLAALGREYLLAGHLMDRAGMPHVIAEFGLEAMRDVAIDEWMAASPIYTRRIQRALGFEGDDVATIFKGMQFDIGAPHEFMDFRYEVHDERHGEFWLASCGALMDVEPMGEEFVLAMCHDIEDPTFDATACATNPRARVRPVHRPPRVSADDHPHCRWTVDIDPAVPPIREPEGAHRLAGSAAASVELRRPGWDAGAGARDYSGPFDPELHLERFDRPTLSLVLEEVCLQGQLLSRSFMLALEDRFGRDAAARIGRKQSTGIAGLTARRLARFLGSPPGLDGIARVLALHPAFLPRAYVDFRIESEDRQLLVSMYPCPALDEADGLTWAALLLGGDEPLAALVQAVDPRAGVTRAPSPHGDAAATWLVQVDAAAPPAPEPPEVAVTLFSTGADFRFSPG